MTKSSRDYEKEYSKKLPNVILGDPADTLGDSVNL